MWLAKAQEEQQLETGELVSENREMAGVFNQYFSSVFTIENERLPAPVIAYDCEEPLVEVPMHQRRGCAGEAKTSRPL